eukprot:NODE_1402_length_1151_cov_323.447080.p1 GENE.NODE_1402_length_1151_cov_323.447080~~NODE_1402_length_1151_cov_323.447080.p1  ORF type:complete len:335 (+),score=116.77 NODE_1402_length_1151_cov_323.447080:116-1006(+)
MVVISNDAVCNTGGLYSRLWCVWEVHCAMKDGVKILMHPRTSSELHLFGAGGKTSFNPKKDARCGKPGSKRTADEISIRKTIETTGRPPWWTWWLPCCPSSCFPMWPEIKKKILERSEYTTRQGRMDADGCHLGHRGVKLLLEVMAEDPSKYTTLDLMCHSFDDRAAEALAAALQHNTTLKELYLRGNRIGDDGAKALAAALRHNTTLTVLDLEDNKIGDGGAEALAAALQHNTTLETLLLSHNEIGDDGAKALAAALQHNSTLWRLELYGNKIGEGGKQALKAVTEETGRHVATY